LIAGAADADAVVGFEVGNGVVSVEQGMVEAVPAEDIPLFIDTGE
jgi:hypothetical protein